MAKDPAFLFYSQDFIVGVQTMPFEDRGKYITILCQMHQQGRLDEETIRFIVGSISDKLRLKFKVDEKGLWYNERLETETARRNNFTESRRLNGKSGGRPKKSKPSAKPTKNLKVKHMDNHMGNEIVNENETVILKDKSEVFESLFTDEIYLDQLSSTHQGKDLKQAFEECYTHHSNAPNPPQELWEWRQKLNTWLTIKKTEKQNGTRIDKRTADTIARREAFEKQVRSGNTG